MIEPKDAAVLRAVKPVICYPVETLPVPDVSLYEEARKTLIKIDEAIAAPRDAATFIVPAGHFFRIKSVEGSQVGDLNLWNADDLSEKFYTGKTRALHGTHITTGQQMWSIFRICALWQQLLMIRWVGTASTNTAVLFTMLSGLVVIPTPTTCWLAGSTIIAATPTCRVPLGFIWGFPRKRPKPTYMTFSTSLCAQDSPATRASTL